MASLRTLNTLGVECEADVVHEASDVDDLRRAWQAAGGAPLLLGGGSNVVLPPRFRGHVCRLVMKGVAHAVDAAGTVRISAAAGESWHGLVRYTLAHGWTGLENLALIPGSVGAAPLQNIGAYGIELGDRLEGVTVFDPAAGECRELAAQECGFGYRTSRFRERPGFVVTAIRLRLEQGASPVTSYPDVALELERSRCAGEPVTARRVAAAVIRVRRRKLPNPRRIGNVGSFFKNPVVGTAFGETVAAQAGLTVHQTGPDRVKLSAAQLIDRCGWKGRREGAVGVWGRQPLVLVNLGGATGPDFLALADRIAHSVAERFGVTLEIEPTVVTSPR